MKRVQSFEDARKRRSVVLKILGIFVIIFFIYEFVTFFGVKTYTVGSNSMNPVIQKGDCVAVFSSAYSIGNPFSINRYKTTSPSRGDIILVNPPSVLKMKWNERLLSSIIRFVTLQRIGLKKDNALNNSSLIKRVIAVPGDSIMMKDYIAYIKTADSAHYLTEFEVSGKTYDLETSKLPETWNKDMPLSGNFDSITLKEDEYFVISDERVSSIDSRFFGPVTSQLILGKVILRYWPFDSFCAF